MFQAKSRLSGMEFASCSRCDNGTSAADLVASFFARISHDMTPNDWQVREMVDRKAILELKAPGVVRELFRPDKNHEIWQQTKAGFLKLIKINADGPLLSGYLTVFASKLGMALFREHVGQPLPMGAKSTLDAI
jgi:hypothetical protein